MALDSTTICPMCGASTDGSARLCLSCGEELRPIASDDRTGWLINPPLRMIYLIGAATTWTAAYSTALVSFFGIATVIQFRTGAKVDIAGHWLWLVGPLHIGTLLQSFALVAYYLAFLF